MFCYKCGKEISDNAKFCSKCGTPQQITEIAPPPQENTEPTPAPVPEPTPAPEPAPIPAPTPPPTREPISVSAPAPAPAPQIIVNPIMLKLKTPYYWISKVCLVFVVFCLFLPFASSYSGCELLQLTVEETDPRGGSEIYIYGFMLLFLLIVATFAIVAKIPVVLKVLLIAIAICLIPYPIHCAYERLWCNGIIDFGWVIGAFPIFGIICSVLMAILFYKAQRFYEFTGIICTLFVSVPSDAEVYEPDFGFFIIIGLFVLAFIFATADKHVVKAQKKLEKLQENMTNTNQYQQL